MVDETPQGAKAGRELTGRHVLAIVVTFFAVIIAVNVFMAYSAIGTFPGLETPNSYVASQEFDKLRAAQEALGWKVDVSLDGEQLVVDIRDTAGDAVEVAVIGGIFGRATHVKDDQEPVFSQSSTGAYVAPIGKLAGGNWHYRMRATAKDGTPFQQLLTLYVSGN